ncbi:MAG: GGDEF domain-containing protein [Treponema sp.]|nr:GGDEF domain-containing protein [Treponema sp.]
MSERKTIAVCVTGHSVESDSKILSGIKNYCSELDINVLVFAAPIKRSNIETVVSKTSAEQLIRGENEIFNLINYKYISGVIVLGETFSDSSIVDKIAEKCRKNNVPVVNVNDKEHKLQNNVFLEDDGKIKELVGHLVKDHKCKKINFIGGIKGNRKADERLEIFRDAMKAYNLPFEEDQFGYGNFWEGAVEVTKQFMNQKEKPDAIVCANDVMAIFAMDYLQNNGYKIPEDIIVTGYDGIGDAFLYEPSVTTIQPNYKKAGAIAVDIVLNPEAVKGGININAGTQLIMQGSCGCKWEKQKKQEYNYMGGALSSKRSTGFFTRNILGIYNNASMAESIEELCGALLQGVWNFGFNSIRICLNRDIEKGELSLSKTSDISKDYNGISDKVVSMSNYGTNVVESKVFNSSDLLPEGVYNTSKAIYLCFSPLHFKDKFLGYVAYEPGDQEFQGEQLSVWMMTAANEIGAFYSIRELESLYAKDSLTGLNNRRGMKKAFARMFPKNLDMLDAPTGYFTVVCADIDYLKPINDKFGHEAGDNAIVKVANAIKTCFPKEAVCVRTGGDEFVVLLQTKTVPKIERYIEKTEDYLDRYNEESNLPYKCYCSLGYHTVPCSEVIGLSPLQKIADRKLYEIKEIRHGHKY